MGMKVCVGGCKLKYMYPCMYVCVCVCVCTDYSVMQVLYILTSSLNLLSFIFY